MKPFRIRHDDPFYKPHKRPDYVDYSSFNPHIEEGPTKRTSKTRTSYSRVRGEGLEVLRNDRHHRGVSVTSTYGVRI